MKNTSEQKFEVGEIVHLDYNFPFSDTDGVVIGVVIRSKTWAHRYKYHIEVERSYILGLIKVKHRKWFKGELFICKKLN